MNRVSNRVTIRVAAFAALALTGVLCSPLQSQAVPGNQQVDGVATFATSGCDEIPTVFPAFAMSGSLEGCWYTTSFTVLQATPSGAYRERGTETFIGCLNASGGQTCGSFNTTYQFEAKYQTVPPFAEIHGRCQHPIVSGTGGFAKISGRIDFKDDVANGCLYYRGHISLG